MRRWAWLGALALMGTGCTSEECRDEPPSIAVELSGDLSGAQSIEIRIAYDDVQRTVPSNVEKGAVGVRRIGLIPLPSAGAQIDVSVTAYTRLDARGARVAMGTTSASLTGDGCNVIGVAMSPVDAAPRDGGVAVDAGDAGIVERDAGERDGGVVERDGGVPRDGGAPICATGITRDSLMLYDFETLPELVDGTGRTNAEWMPLAADIAPSATEGPEGCGDAIAFEGDGAVIVHLEGQPVASVDLWVRFDQGPDGYQGIVSRDVSGQTEPGHFSLFRTCEGRLVVRVQDTEREVYHCSEDALPIGDWHHVGLRLANEIQLAIDGKIQTPQGTAALFSEGCAPDEVTCGGQLTLDPATAADVAIVTGAASHMADATTHAPLTAPFYGAVDGLHARSR